MDIYRGPVEWSWAEGTTVPVAVPIAVVVVIAAAIVLAIAVIVLITFLVIRWMTTDVTWTSSRTVEAGGTEDDE